MNRIALFVSALCLALCLALLLVLPLSAQAARQSVQLSVPGMDCALCPITVKKALSRVKGVEQVQVDYDKRLASVIFDEALTDVAALTRATRDAGYPSTPVARPGTSTTWPCRRRSCNRG